MSRWIGLLRSLVVYWRPGRQRRLRALYRTWVGRGDLVFDVGAHLGDRSVAFAALGARVIALEPQPHVVPWLRWIVRRRPAIEVRPEAVGRSAGTSVIAISARRPTVSTLSEEWRTGLPTENAGFRDVDWDETAEVPVVTLDALVEEYGAPRFCKIDVEGFEAEVLAGLSRPLAGLSFEFVSGGLDVATASVERLEELGRYEYNVVIGEGREFVFDDDLDGGAVLAWIEAGAGGASSGDVYARLLGEAVDRAER